jgi:hypothetical protein
VWAWGIAAVVHVVGFVVAFSLRLDFTPPPSRFVALVLEPEAPPFSGVRPGRGTAMRLGRNRARGPVTVPVEPVESLPRIVHPEPVLPAREPPGFIRPPSPGDGRLWVSPRPALPSDVADAIYLDHEPRDSQIVARLRAMVDSLNVIVDSEQRANRPPSWVARNGEGKPVWGLDQSGLYVAGIKIPTAALVLLGGLLPPGNYDEAVRRRRLEDMRTDLMQAAARTQNLEHFRRYVRELRARKQAEHEAQRRQQGDTASVQP